MANLLPFLLKVISHPLMHMVCMLAGDEVEQVPAPGLFFIGLIGLGLLVASVLLFAFLFALSIFGFFFLVSAGVVSTSLFVGLYYRSLTKGFKTFVYLVSGGLSTLFGFTTIYGLGLLTNWWVPSTGGLFGGILGLIIGVLLAYLIVETLHKLLYYLKNKLVHHNPR